MSSDPGTTRIVRAWLDEGVTELPDRVLDAVLDQLPAIPQHRVAWWPARGASTGNSVLAAALAVAAVLVTITLIGQGLLGGGRVGGPGGDEATPTPTPRELPIGLIPIEPGRYTLAPGFPVDVTLDVPDGWMACAWSVAEQGVCSPTPDAASVALVAVENVVVHPCNAQLLEPPAGRSIEAFLSALAGLAGFSVTEPVGITRSGFAGQRVTVTAPVDPACPNLRTWSVRDRTNGVGAGEVNVVEVFDVGGHVVAITGAYLPRVLPAEDMRELRSIMDSVEIRP